MKNALLSVSDKTGIVEFAKNLIDLDYRIISTGGTAQILRDNNLEVTGISDITEFPECFDGRVKTLHPKVHGGILNIRDNKEHQKQKEELGIEDIDLICINLYPFVKTVESGKDFATCIENIDIGGPAMLRSGAKNFKFVTVVSDPDDYSKIIEEIREHGDTTEDLRLKLALKVFETTNQYDLAIANYLRSQVKDIEFPEKLTLSFEKLYDVRYGENPHQKAAFYSDLSNEKGTLVTAEQLQGKELSYNNINDTNGAIEILKEFDEPTIVAVKHANACAICSDTSIKEAYKKAYEADPTSIFGGIVASNEPIDAETAKMMKEIFLEVVIAPDFSDKALEILSEKPNLRLLKQPDIREQAPGIEMKSVRGGLLVQDRDTELIDELKVVTNRKPTDKEMEDLMFAWKAVKNTKSNAISLAKDKVLIANGPGQVNRVWPTENCITHAGEKAKGSVLASDAFFPFDDCVKLAADAGITAIIQPGGSIRDQDSIDVCNENDIAMVFTGMRHFKHS